MTTELWALGAVVAVLLLALAGDGNRKSGTLLTGVLVLGVGALAFGLWIAAQLRSYGFDLWALAAQGGVQ